LVHSDDRAKQVLVKGLGVTFAVDCQSLDAGAGLPAPVAGRIAATPARMTGVTAGWSRDKGARP